MYALLAMLQDTAPATQMGALIAAALAPIVGWAGSKAFDGLKQALGEYEEKVPAVLKAAAAPLLTAGLHFVSTSLALDVIDAPAAITVQWLTSGLSALVALGIKRAEGKRA